MSQEQVDRVEINGRQYVVTHFVADSEGGTFRALKFDSLAWTQSSNATLLPADISIRILQVGAAFGDEIISEFYFRFK